MEISAGASGASDDSGASDNSSASDNSGVEIDDKFYYINAPYSEQVLCLDNDINTWVYPNKDATESSVEIIPAGTTFRRFRIPKNAEYNFVEGILEDGRVFRVVEEYWFSEPTAYQAMMDKDKKQFNYSVK